MNNRKALIFFLLFILSCTYLKAAEQLSKTNETIEVEFHKGTLRIHPLLNNAFRIQYVEGNMNSTPELLYLGEIKEKVSYKIKENENTVTFLTKSMKLIINKQSCCIYVEDRSGNILFKANSHELTENRIHDIATNEAKLIFETKEDEHLYGLGQFQDGHLNIKGLSRRLTQVNTQISVPFLLSSNGYGLLWNNYGLTDFNPADKTVRMMRSSELGEKRVVNVTSTEGGQKEVRQDNKFAATIHVPEDGEYSILLDVGQKMARRHHLSINGKTVIDLQNLWLPPTTSVITPLKAGEHLFESVLETNDKPSVQIKKVDERTVFRSPVSDCVDYTLFVGDADEVISAYRKVTGHTPMLPKWSFGYIHCRERFHNQNELLETAKRFRKEGIPLDLIVQDWQYWGKYGWNAMKFDEQNYPNPSEMVSRLHQMNMRLMLSVWSKIDTNSELGKKAAQKGHYIPNTSWIDFFDTDASDFYWENMSERLLKPYKIDAWWQDATEPENDDLQSRRIMKGKEIGERYRNIYPNMVSKTVYEGLRKDDPDRRAMIFTRSGYAGIQRYGSVLWSGDVGNDWQTLRYQITAGLGFNAAGLPWWTYDAGGFFRPHDQYTNKKYIERMIRWIQVSTFLPFMRVHGYMSNTEPWNYGEEAKNIITDCIKLRYRLLPYIYSEAAKVSFSGSTIMRPLLFDFPHDKEALKQEVEYMFGQSLLISPVLKSSINEWTTYLPNCKAGWYDFNTGKKYDGGQNVTTPVTLSHIPVFVKGGTILPYGPEKQWADQNNDAPMEIRIYPGSDANFELYEDEGDNYNYEKGEYSIIKFKWNDKKRILTIDNRQGAYKGMPAERTFIICHNGIQRPIKYQGNRIKVKF